MSDPNRWAAAHKAKVAAKKAKKRTRHSSSASAQRAVGRRVEHASTLGKLDLSNDLVTVSVPTWNTSSRLLERAVRSVLDGEHRNVRVVVISDGEKKPAWRGLSEETLSDPRVVCLRSPKNMGPYFNHDVVLRATPGPLFAVQDSDDESKSRRFVAQLSAMHSARAEAVHSSIHEIQTSGRRQVLKGSAAVGENFVHRANHFGLYSVDALLRLGGYHCGFRVGYDTVITSLLNLLAVTRMSKSVDYVRRLRRGSMTQAGPTKFGGSMRREHRAALLSMWQTAYSKSRNSRTVAANWVRNHATSRASRYGNIKLRDTLTEQLRDLLKGVAAETPPVHEALLERVIAGTPTSEWSISKRLANALYEDCVKERPKVILDAGSGLSTSVLALYAARYGARVVSLEHDRKWLDQTRGSLSRMGLLSHVSLVHAPLAVQDGEPWYGVPLGPIFSSQKIDLIFIDGPPDGAGGRAAAMRRLRPYVRDGTSIWLHDALRDNEKRAVSRWRKEVRVESCLVDASLDPRGVARLRVSP